MPPPAVAQARTTRSGPWPAVYCVRISWPRLRTGSRAARAERTPSTEHRGGATAPWERGRLARWRPLRVHDTLTPASRLQRSHPNLDTPDARSLPGRSGSRRSHACRERRRARLPPASGCSRPTRRRAGTNPGPTLGSPGGERKEPTGQREPPPQPTGAARRCSFRPHPRASATIVAQERGGIIPHPGDVGERRGCMTSPDGSTAATRVWRLSSQVCRRMASRAAPESGGTGGAGLRGPKHPAPPMRPETAQLLYRASQSRARPILHLSRD
jgi:hypothetical protein